MAGTRCVHGIDSRFCAVCNRASKAKAAPPRIAIGDPLPEIQEFLKVEGRASATPRAIADVLGVNPRSLAAQLGVETADDGSAIAEVSSRKC